MPRLRFTLLVCGLVAASGLALGQDTEESARSLSRLSLDRGFGQRGKLSRQAGRKLRVSRLEQVALDSEGRIVAAGAETISGDPHHEGVHVEALRVVRLRPNGRRDRDFGDGGTAELTLFGAPSGLAVLLSGLADRPLVVGRFVAPDGEIVGAVRLRENGTRDSSFGGNGLVELEPGSALDGTWRFPHILPADRALVVAVDAGPNWRIVRLTGNGDLDPAFGIGGIVDLPDFSVTRMAVDAGGSIVLDGNAGRFPDYGPRHLLRFAPDGSPDPGFELLGPSGAPVTGGLRFDAQGRLVVDGGDGTNHGFFRFLPDGSPDLSFSADGYAPQRFGVPGNAEVGGHLAIAPGDVDRWVMYSGAEFFKKTRQFANGWYVQAIDPGAPEAVAVHVERDRRSHRRIGMTLGDVVVTPDARFAIAVGRSERYWPRRTRYEPLMVRVDLRPRSRVALPNLVAQWNEAPTFSLDEGAVEYHGHVRVRNIGAGRSTDAEVTFYLSDDDDVDEADDVLWSKRTGAIRPGGQTLVRLPSTGFSANGSTPAGKRLIAVVNRGERVLEKDFTDGVAVSPPIR